MSVVHSMRDEVGSFWLRPLGEVQLESVNETIKDSLKGSLNANWSMSSSHFFSSHPVFT